MRKQVLTVIAALMLAGCTAVSETPEPANAPAGNQGCDAFEACEDASADQSETVMTFKEDYESLNGVANSSGKLHRTITISETHPFVYAQPADILNMIEQLRTMFSKQITAQLTSLSVTASFGIVVYPSDGNNTELLLDNAIIAVYNAKANGKDRPCFFSRTVNQSVYVPESVYAPQSTYIPESKYYPTE